MTVQEEVDQLLPDEQPSYGQLKPGDLNAEGRLRMIHGPYPTCDDVPAKRNEVCFHAGPGRWFAAVHVM